MLTSTAPRLFETTDPNSQQRRVQTRAWRPVAVVPDLLCLESAPAGEIGPWMHARFAVTVFKSGALIRLESRRSFLAEADGVLLVPPLHAYSIRPPAAVAPSITLLFHRPSGVERRDEDQRPALTTRSELVAPIVQLVSELARPVRSVEHPIDAALLLERLFNESTPAGTAEPSGAATPLRPLRDYLLAHRSLPVPISALAEMAGLTESHCIRAFHHEFGLPPHAYQLRLRLAEASKLLACGHSVSTVAYDCGFADQSHLSRKFREVYGLAPGAWASIAGARTSQPRLAGGRLGPQSLMRRERARRTRESA
jgi:AraC-like DNA-binding protein